MITDFIMDWFYAILNSGVETLPADPMPSTLDLGWIQDMNYFLPLTEMFGLFVVFFALGGPFVASSLVIWFVIGVLRGGATKA